MAGSRVPQRVPMMRPSSGVRPIVVSMHWPSSMAQRLAPEPRWQLTSLWVLSPMSSWTVRQMKRWLVPWAPYLRTWYLSTTSRGRA